MTEPLLIALIAAGAAVAGGVITGGFNYYATVRQRDTERYKRRLLQCYKDIAAFYRLEEIYTNMLETKDQSAYSIKIAARKQLRESGVVSPSDDATLQKCERGIAELS